MSFDRPGDPAGLESLLGAVQWVEGSMLGTVATTIAVVAVAATGMMMLSGRIDWRRGASMILGCFIVFGASSIAAGIRAAAIGDGDGYMPPPAVAPPFLAVMPGTRARASAPTGNDPYATAAMPVGQPPAQQ